MSLPAGPGGGGGAVLPGLYTYEVPCSQQQRHTEWPRRFSRVMGNVRLKPSLGQHLFRRPTCQAGVVEAPRRLPGWREDP